MSLLSPVSRKWYGWGAQTRLFIFASIRRFYRDFNNVLRALMRFRKGTRDRAKNARKSRLKQMDFGWVSVKIGNKKMDFPPKLWVFPVDFKQRCAIMIESFEAGNTNVFKGFPILLTSGTHTKRIGRGFLLIRRFWVRSPGEAMTFQPRNTAFFVAL